MTQLLVTIRNKRKLPFFRELLKHLDFVEVTELPELTAKEKKILAGLENSVQQVKLHKKGRVKLKTPEDVLNDI